MYKKNGNKSLLFTLLAPVFTATLLLLLFASLTISAIYIRQTEDAAIQSNLEILKQTDVSLQLLHNHISQTASDLVSKPYLADTLLKPMLSVQDEYNGRQKIGRLLAQNPRAMVDYEVTILGINGFVISSGNGGPNLTAEEMMELPVFTSSLSTNHIAYDCRQNGISYSTADTPVILGCRALKKSGGTLCGGILISIREKSLRQFYQSFINQNTNILLLSARGRVLSSARAEDVGTTDTALLKTVKKNKADNLTYSRTKSGEMILSRYIAYYDSYIVSRIAPAAIYSSFFPSIQTLGIVIATLAVLIVFMVFSIRRNLIPLQKLADHMASAKNVPTPAAVTGAAEITMITAAYNKMTATLQQYLEELNAAHEKERKDELDLLQMQINPHFLYNTLDSVKHLIEIHNTNDACRITDSLISLLRSTLGKTNTMVPVAHELSNVRNYIAIIVPRYGGLIQAEIHAEPACLDYEMPNLLLQPLVENAFFHAFQQSKSGQIRIYLSVSQDELSCEVMDNGDGMTAVQLEHIFSSTNVRQSVTKIGLANVKERLSILYPGKSRFQITSEPGYGTNISISFPAVRCT